MPNPFAHVELSTDDVKKAKKFYSAVFAWKLNDLPAMAYTTIDVSGGVAPVREGGRREGDHGQGREGRRQGHARVSRDR